MKCRRQRRRFASQSWISRVLWGLQVVEHEGARRGWRATPPDLVQEGAELHRAVAPLAGADHRARPHIERGEAVYEPFSGSGTTIIAAEMSGRACHAVELDPNVAIPFLNETSGSAVIARALRMEACSPIVARHTGAAQDCEYEVAWANTYHVRIQYTPSATRCGNAVINRHRAPHSRWSCAARRRAERPRRRLPAERDGGGRGGPGGGRHLDHGATTLAGLSFNGLDGIAATSRGLLLRRAEGLRLRGGLRRVRS